MSQIDGFHTLTTATLHALLTKHLRKASASAHVPTALMRTIGSLRRVLRLRGENV